jgi:two-component system, OmpR family, sensor histidine kinase CiaH
MFRTARIKLTAWYLLIIMMISLAFSLTIYRSLSDELDRVEHIQQLRIQRDVFGLDSPPSSAHIIIDPDIILETKHRILFFLASINLIILGTSSLAGYFLAGRTLKPIKEMVDEQSQFITNASHELRTPLTALKSEIEVNLRNKKLTISETKKILRSNLEEVNNLQTLSDGLIKLTQFQKGQTNFPITKIDIVNIINDAIKKIYKLSFNKQITIDNQITAENIEGNAQMLTELFVIFLDNSIKYSPINSTIRLYSEKTDGHIIIHIQDEGMGISPKDIPHIFDRFYRADKSRTKNDISGYGLGLSIAKKIIDSHQGSIKVQSKIGIGSDFSVQLPVRHIKNYI